MLTDWYEKPHGSTLWTEGISSLADVYVSVLHSEEPAAEAETSSLTQMNTDNDEDEETATESQTTDIENVRFVVHESSEEEKVVSASHSAKRVGYKKEVEAELIKFVSIVTSTQFKNDCSNKKINTVIFGSRIVTNLGD